ncbi:response regulator transcription factor [Cytophagaceae bacterium YF14B1]|uniref:Response regulator transcription factor n=1 Tax=Xanthocytophaga flava TaxID=3048013 RepID=A0AAE3U8Z9_9BACT|nr:response regulator transcription factor [Xanthocytophaga flavus]MDJ1483991.1 response regulator transcription factor [Xanthocytophaga flavus]
MNTKILLAEDEPKLAANIRETLTDSGFDVQVAFDGTVAERLYKTIDYQLVILDVNLPYKNGFELCKLFRQQNKDIPIIMLTALGELDDKILAFDAGADDYLVKPFHFQELLARIQVFLKRSVQHTALEEKIMVADLQIDLLEKKARRGGKDIELTMREFSLLELLAQANGRVVSKVEIAEKVWDVNFDTGTNTIEVYISFLRNKIDKPFDRKLIHTKPGFGYYLKDVSA